MKDIEIYKNYSLKNLSTFKIGGECKFAFICYSTKAIISSIKYCKTHKIPFKIIGLGANLLFNDNGYNGAIIVNKSNNIEFLNSEVLADSGVNVSNLINKCYLRSLSGLENLAGIPATIGGGVVNNLGAFNTELSEFVDYVSVVDLNNPNKIINLPNKACDFGYRHSIFQNNQYAILKVKLNLKQDEKSLIHERIVNAIKTKTQSQPLNYPSAGSVFKRSNIIPAKLIDQLGLKGKVIGRAKISDKHAGFIVNLDNASSEDVKNLISFIKTEIEKAYNQQLETEIEFVD